ncbi:hypothetical protein BRD02_08450 [Halobacteriales archaeon QS_8_69_73]|nr:MAG: hypothetical protein BRD02_08450 [Halobacteriales archaeon QS_8_69_73]
MSLVVDRYLDGDARTGRRQGPLRLVAVARAANDPLHGEQSVVEPDRREQGGDRDVEADREAVDRRRERHSAHEHAADWSVRPQVSRVGPSRQVRTGPVTGGREYDFSFDTAPNPSRCSETRTNHRRSYQLF